MRKILRPARIVGLVLSIIAAATTIAKNAKALGLWS